MGRPFSLRTSYTSSAAINDEDDSEEASTYVPPPPPPTLWYLRTLYVEGTVIGGCSEPKGSRIIRPNYDSLERTIFSALRWWPRTTRTRTFFIRKKQRVCRKGEAAGEVMAIQLHFEKGWQLSRREVDFLANHLRSLLT